MMPPYPLTLLLTSLIILSMAYTHKNILMCLLNLEALTLSLLLATMLHLNYSQSMGAPCLLMTLTMAACEGALGLTILVMTMRTHGNDLMKTITSFTC